MTQMPPGQVVPDGYAFQGMSRCRSCPAAIAWCLTKASKRAPLNLDGTSHFADCPGAANHRRAK